MTTMQLLQDKLAEIESQIAAVTAERNDARRILAEKGVDSE